MSTETLGRAAAALLADLDLKTKRQVIGEDEKARVRFLKERKTGHQAAKEPAIDAWLRLAMADDFSLRQRLFHAWLQKAELAGVPGFDEHAEEDSSKGKKPRTFPAETKTVTALKKLFKTWLEAGDNRQVEIYAYMGPYEFPEKVLATIPEALPEAVAEEEEAKVGGASEAEVEALKKDYEKKLERAEAELAKIKKLLEQAQGKREADLNKVEETFKKEREQLQSRLADSASSQKKLQEEVSSKSQPISQLKRDLEDAQRLGDKLSRDLAETKAALETAEKKRDDAISRRDALEVELKAEKEERTKLTTEVKEISKKLEDASAAATFLEEARTWMLVDADALTEVVENMETELDVRSDFKDKFNVDLSKKGGLQYRVLDFHGVWKKLLAEESDIVEEFFDIALKDTLAEGDKFREANSRLYDLKDSLLAREMAALALNEIGNRFLDRKKAPPTPAKA